MFYLKNDDMEDLFRKAAENYEVDTGKASNWEAINDALHNSNNGGDDSKDKKKKKRRFIFWWFLLFPAGWIAHNTWTKIDANNAEHYQKFAAPVQFQPVDKKQEDVVQNKIQKPGSIKDQDKDNRSPDEAINSKSSFTKTDENTDISNSNNDKPKRQSLSSKKDGNIEKDISQQKAVAETSNPLSKKELIKKKIADNNKLNKNNSNKTSAFVLNARLKQRGISGNVNTGIIDHTNSTELFEKNKQQISKNKKENAGIGTGDPTTDDFSVFASPQLLSDDLFWTLQPVSTDLSSLQLLQQYPDNAATDSNNAQKPKDVVKQKNHYFYALAMAAPDLTTVKFQHFSGTGSSFGLLLGYRFNKRLHVEAGAFLEKKLYYTKGSYFDGSKLYPPGSGSTEILDVDGNCKMITVPINFRYNVFTNAKTNLFIATGVSSYFMSRENYDLNVKHPGGTTIYKERGIQSIRKRLVVGNKP
ncbi:MAG: hypothetical protein QM802_05855 [Agriterribacter sp.]